MSEENEFLRMQVFYLLSFMQSFFLSISNLFHMIEFGFFLIEYIKFCLSQAIQNQVEMDALRKKLEFCMEEKEKLER